MTAHRNLYQFLQKGWESINAKVKLTFFYHMQRRGNFGKEGEKSEKSYLRAIYTAFQRKVMWIFGVGEDHFLVKINN
jgi:hypothetical protein